MARLSLSLLAPALVLLLALLPSALAGPEPVNDFADPAATAADFVVRNFSTNRIHLPAGSLARTSVANLPGGKTLGISNVIVTVAVNALLTPHWHPRGSETVFVMKGKARANFIDTKNVLRSSELNEGDLTLYPRGLIHWTENIGTEPLQLFFSADGEDAGVVHLNQITKLMSNRVLKATFQTRKATAEQLRNPALLPLEFYV